MVDEEEIESGEYLKNDEWFKDHFLELIEKYPREWLAVKEQRIIANGVSKNEVRTKAEGVAGDREYSLYFVPPTATVTDTGYSHR